MKKLMLILICSLPITMAMAQSDKEKKKSRKDARNERINAMAKLEEEGVIINKKHTILIQCKSFYFVKKACKTLALDCDLIL